MWRLCDFLIWGHFGVAQFSEWQLLECHSKMTVTNKEKKQNWAWWIWQVRCFRIIRLIWGHFGFTQFSVWQLLECHSKMSVTNKEKKQNWSWWIWQIRCFRIIRLESRQWNLQIIVRPNQKYQQPPLIFQNFD